MVMGVVALGLFGFVFVAEKFIIPRLQTKARDLKEITPDGALDESLNRVRVFYKTRRFLNSLVK